jgi:hypothetical protein
MAGSLLSDWCDTCGYFRDKGFPKTYNLCDFQIFWLRELVFLMYIYIVCLCIKYSYNAAGTSVSHSNKADRHDITEILLKVA